jgi:hypothetical protein
METASRPLTLSLPADAPVADLLPGIVRACGGDWGRDGWSLRLREGELVDPERSLHENRVRRGAVLRLVEPLGWPGRDSALWPMARLPWWPRIEMAVSSARTPRPRPTVRHVPLDGPIDPRSLAEPPAVGTLARAVSAWRDTDYAVRLRSAIVEAQALAAALIVVVAREPAAGTTTVAALLGATLSRLRRERVLIVDACGNRGLSELVGPGLHLADDLFMQLGSRPVTFTEFEGLLARGPETTAILPAPRSSSGSARTDARIWAGLLAQMMRWMPTVIVDLGHDMDGAAGEAALTASDFVVMVSSRDRRALDFAAPAAESLWRRDHNVVLVANHLRAGLVLWRSALSPAGCPLISLPYHRHAPGLVREAGPSWIHLPASWRIAGSELGALIMAARR